MWWWYWCTVYPVPLLNCTAGGAMRLSKITVYRLQAPTCTPCRRFTLSPLGWVLSLTPYTV
nr:MAG TPA: hypothetical protein [Caudoviricetes sp.]